MATILCPPTSAPEERAVSRQMDEAITCPNIDRRKSSGLRCFFRNAVLMGYPSRSFHLAKVIASYQLMISTLYHES